MNTLSDKLITIQPDRQYRYFDLVMVAFVVILLCSNVIGVAKRAQIGGFTFGAGIIFFPISYVFGDILTEVYGYKRSRRVIWAGFSALAFASLMSWIIVSLPPAPNWPHQAAYEVAFGNTPRVALASLIAFWVGEFSNSFVLAKMKLNTKGKFLWMRTIGSTIVGEGVDSLVFFPLALLGRKGWTTEAVIQVMTASYLLKVGWETLMTPFTYKIVNFLKKAENEDFYDGNTDFNPFKLTH